jgi:hypothetical protein
MQAQLHVADTLQLCENLSHQVFRAQGVWTSLLFAFGALTAVLYGLISDCIDKSPTRWRKFRWKVVCGLLLFGALYVVSILL